jgi:hypothetical protein
MTCASVTDQVTAWATLAAVLVALGLSILPSWWRRHKRPVFELSVGTTEPHRVASWSGEGRFEGSELRMAVMNKPGRRQAENVRAQVQRVLIFTPNDPKPWSDPDFGITPLVWATRKSEQLPLPSEAFVTVIPSGLTDYVEFAFWTGQSRNLNVRDARLSSNRALERFAAGHMFIFRLAVTADGIEPRIRDVCVALSESIDSIQFTQEPRPDEIQQIGLFATFYSGEAVPSAVEEPASDWNPEHPEEPGR